VKGFAFVFPPFPLLVTDRVRMASERTWRMVLHNIKVLVGEVAESPCSSRTPYSSRTG